MCTPQSDARFIERLRPVDARELSGAVRRAIKEEQWAKREKDAMDMYEAAAMLTFLHSGTRLNPPPGPRLTHCNPG